MSKFLEFEDAQKELESLINEDFFGLSVKKFYNQIGSENTAQYFYNILEDWAHNDNQYQKENVKKLILIFMQLYTDGMRVKGQETVDLLTYFMKGYPDNPESENLSSFTEYIRSHKESSELMKEYGYQLDLPIHTKIKLGQSFVDTYTKGFEFVSKILTTLILILQVSKQENIDILKVNSLFFGQKSKLFKSLSNSKYDLIIDLLNRDIRNSYSHLNLRYSSHKTKYLLKIKSGKKFKTKELSVEDFLLNIYPTVGHISQGFIYSCALLILAGTDEKLYFKGVKSIYG